MSYSEEFSEAIVDSKVNLKNLDELLVSVHSLLDKEEKLESIARNCLIKELGGKTTYNNILIVTNKRVIIGKNLPNDITEISLIEIDQIGLVEDMASLKIELAIKNRFIDIVSSEKENIRAFFKKLISSTREVKPEVTIAPFKKSHNHLIALIAAMVLIVSWIMVGGDEEKTAINTANNEKHELISDPTLSNDIKYSILKDTYKKGVKRSVEVLLEKKISQDELKQLANDIKNSDPSSYQSTFISYYLKGQNKNNGYWATTHFNPNLNVRVLNLSSKEDTNLAQQETATTPDRKIVGMWLDNRPYIGAKMTLFFSKAGKLYLESIYSDGSSQVQEMIVSAIGNAKKIEFKGSNAFGEYFVLNNAKQLEFWSKSGNYFTAKSIK